MSEIITLIKYLPLILGLLRSIEEGIKEAETDAKISDHLIAVRKSFDEQDASHLDSIFNNK